MNIKSWTAARTPVSPPVFDVKTHKNRIAELLNYWEQRSGRVFSSFEALSFFWRMTMRPLLLSSNARTVGTQGAGPPRPDFGIHLSLHQWQINHLITTY